MSGIVLFGNRESGHAYKVRLMLNVAAIPHRFEEIDVIGQRREERPEPFRSLARYGEVPLLLHDGTPYAQSNAILLHLAGHTRAFGAQDEGQLARVREWLFWETNRIGFSLPNLRWHTKFATCESAVLGMLRERFDADIARLDAELADGRAFIVADAPTVADFSLCGYLFFADQAGVEVPPNVRAWLDRIASLPGWRHPYSFYD